MSPRWGSGLPFLWLMQCIVPPSGASLWLHAMGSWVRALAPPLLPPSLPTPMPLTSCACSYYTWRRDSFSDLQLFLAFNVALFALGAAVEGALLAGDPSAAGGGAAGLAGELGLASGLWASFYLVCKTVFGQDMPEPSSPVVQQARGAEGRRGGQGSACRSGGEPRPGAATATCTHCCPPLRRCRCLRWRRWLWAWPALPSCWRWLSRCGGGAGGGRACCAKTPQASRDLHACLARMPLLRWIPFYPPAGAAGGSGR